LDSKKVGGNMVYFEYSQDAITYLSDQDPLLGNSIAKIGPIRRAVIPDLFEALVNAIIGQQISTKAQTTIWQRFKDKLGHVTPCAILEQDPVQLQKLGISLRKVDFIRSAAEDMISGRLDIKEFGFMSDEEVIDKLCSLKGVGRWTAEMLLIFSLQRQDILSYGDLAILRGIRMLHQIPNLSKAHFEEFRKLYSPYGSVASLYLWAISGGAIEELQDPASKI